MKVVVVESPAKAKTINQYLGSDYTVLASNGHVRDLPAKSGSVRPEDGFTMQWQSDVKANTQMREISKALKSAENLILATDPDREGEAISWHVYEMLAQMKALESVAVERVVFNEITKSAVLDAIANPRAIDSDMVDAYLARRALDYLVGFTLSPVLWRKLPGARSAGRVQSVALRLVCDREAEIEIFEPQEYWTLDIRLRNELDQPFSARLSHIDSRQLEKFDLPDEAAATQAVALVEATSYSVARIERKKVRRNPPPPFTTSTLQQEASRKLGMSATNTMRTAQRLYEGLDIGGETVGLITYMRTDGVQVSAGAITVIREQIGQIYGADFVPEEPRVYKTRTKNAQEAHEAIRPTDPERHPREAARYLDRAQARLYELIWQRAVASQMASAELEQTAITIDAADGRTVLRASGSVLRFEGFLKLYREDRDDVAADADPDNDRLLPAMREGEGLAREAVTPDQHFTQPPPRYSEASLVKRLEELGIGRPSTYASIIQVLQDRAYVTLEKKRFLPEDRGRLVTAFLASFFSRYVQYNFTADLESELDEIAGGRLEWKAVLHRFWEPFHTSIDSAMSIPMPDVLVRLDAELGPRFFGIGADGETDRDCPRCDDGRLGLKVSRYGAFVGCSNYPDCRFTRQVASALQRSGDGGSETLDEPRLLGEDPETGKPISLRKGPYGLYVQLGELGEKKSDKPKRVSLPRTMSSTDMTLAIAISLLELPREVGINPNSGKMIVAGLGRYGPYLRHDNAFTSISADDDVLSIGLNRAIDLIASSAKKGPAGTVLGEAGGKPVTLRSGRYGPYVQRGQVRANLAKDSDPDSITLEQAVELIQAKEQRGGKAAPKKAPAAKKPANDKKAAAGTATGKKTAAGKTAERKPAARQARAGPTDGQSPTGEQ